MDKLKMHTENKADINYRKLADLFPDAITETIDPVSGDVVRAIDKDILMQEISAHVVEGREERYQFTWPDKKKAILAANAPISATLRPVKEESVGKDGMPGGWDSQNLYIEGDNLDVLKLLQETYLGKIKMIYIDPPYNTGNDFVYDDDFSENVEDYLARSGQFDDQGNRLEQNTESNGRFHTDWLNMMYCRLKLARNLLSEDGLIFISIDENEVENLKKICAEIFGQNSFFGVFIWHRRQVADSRNQTKYSMDHEYVLAYGKKDAALLGVDIDFEKYQNPDNDPRGPWFSDNLTGLADKAHRPNLHYDVVNPETGIIYPPNPSRGWCCNKESFARLIQENKILWPAKPEGRPRRKRFLSEAEKLKTSFSSILDVGFTTEGTKELQTLFDGKVFDFPKPVSLIKTLVEQASGENDIVLDFFCGSATTAQAVFEQNVTDGKSRRFILVQVPEKTKIENYSTLCDIGRERIRRAGKQIREKEGLKVSDLDMGFRSLRLDSSNMEDVYYNPGELSRDLLGRTVDNIKIDRTPEDLLFQVMLDLGVDLSSAIVEKIIDDKKVFIVKPDGVDKEYLVACFDKGITSETVIEIAKMKPYYAVFRDSGMASDSVATNFDQIFRTYSPQTERKVL